MAKLGLDTRDIYRSNAIDDKDKKKKREEERKD